MRVISGKARRLILKGVEGENTRPTTDRIKETLFNMINDDVYGCRFLDLYSGTGGIGIEALSRGAQYCVFIESDKRAVSCIQDNLKHTKLEKDARVIKDRVENAVSMLNESRFDVVFMDPPYDLEQEERILSSLELGNLIDENSLIIIESSVDRDFTFAENMGFEIIKEKKYGKNKHVFLQRRK